jgi:hypothetical protein
LIWLSFVPSSAAWNILKSLPRAAFIGEPAQEVAGQMDTLSGRKPAAS